MFYDFKCYLCEKLFKSQYAGSYQCVWVGGVKSHSGGVEGGGEVWGGGEVQEYVLLIHNRADYRTTCK